MVLCGLDQLKLHAADANARIHTSGLVVLFFGDASEVDRDAGAMAIKPERRPP